MSDYSKDPSREGAGTTSAKEAVKALLDELPEESTFEDIQYHLYVRELLQRRVEQSERLTLVSQEEAERRMAQWLGK